MSHHNVSKIQIQKWVYAQKGLLTDPSETAGSCIQNAAYYIPEDPSDSGVSVTCGMSVLYPGNDNSESKTLASTHQSIQRTFRIVLQG
jgi:hypothetical protein